MHIFICSFTMSRTEDNKQFNLPPLFSLYCGIDLLHDTLKGEPWHYVDKLCQTHDKWYAKIIQERGYKEAYVYANEADEWFLQELLKYTPESYQEVIIYIAATAFFNVKKAILTKGEPTKNLREQPDIVRTLPFNQAVFSVEADGTAKLQEIKYNLEEEKKEDFITPARQIKRQYQDISPEYKDLVRLFDDVDDTDDLELAVSFANILGESLGNLPSEANMSNSNGGVLKETPVSKANPTYGLQNTHTEIMPYNITFSAVDCKWDQMYQLNVRMTSINDLIRTNFDNFTNQLDKIIENEATGTFATETLASGLYYQTVHQYVPCTQPFFTGWAPNGGTMCVPTLAAKENIVTNTQNNTSTAYGTNLPSTALYRPNPGTPFAAKTVTQNSETDMEKPYMRNYWQSFYQYYCTLSTEWELTVTNVSETPGADVIIGELYTAAEKPPMAVTSSSTSPSTDENNAKFTNVAHAMHWKNVKWHTVNSDKGLNGLNNQITIKGTYKRGDVRREILTDDLVETWTNVYSIPKLDEDLTFMFFKHPAAYAPSTARPTVNCYLRLKYIVQYKDLNVYHRFMGYGTNRFQLARSTWTNPTDPPTEEEKFRKKAKGTNYRNLDSTTGGASATGMLDSRGDSTNENAQDLRMSD